MKYCVLVIWVLSCSAVYAATEQQAFDAAGLATVSVSNLVGDIEISVTADDRAYVEANKIEFAGHCHLSIEKIGTKLSIEVTADDKDDEDCQVDFEIKVPESVNLAIKNGVGDIDIEETEGTLHFKVGVGDIDVSALVSKLDGKLGTGDIQVDGLSGGANIKSGSGDVVLHYVEAALAKLLDVKVGAGDVEVTGLAGNASVKVGAGNAEISYAPQFKKGYCNAKMGYGNVVLRVPEAISVEVDFKSGMGELSNPFEYAHDPALSVEVKTGFGDLRLLKANKRAGSVIINKVSAVTARII